MPLTEIKIASFDELQNEIYPTDKKYLPVGEDILERHTFGEQIQKLIQAVSNGSYKKDNIFNLEVVDGIPTAIYGFTVCLNKENNASLMFGNDNANQFNIDVELDEDKEPIFKVGSGFVEFEYDEKSKRTSCFIVHKKTKVSARVILAKKDEKTTKGADLEKCKNVDDLALCLAKPSNGSWSFQLRQLVHPDLISSGKVKLPLILDVISFEQPYVTDKFTSVNINITGAKYAKKDEKDGGEIVEDVKTISAYDYMNAGSICDPNIAAKAILCQTFGGRNQIVITKPNADSSKNPTHIFRQVPPDGNENKIAYENAKKALIQAMRNEEDYSHLLKPDAVDKFLESKSEKIMLAGKTENHPDYDEDEDDEENQDVERKIKELKKKEESETAKKLRNF